MKHIKFHQGCKTYYNNGNPYRFISEDGFEQWYYFQDRKYILHRIDGPAVILNSESKRFYYNGKIRNGKYHFIVDGKMLDCNTQEEFEKLLPLLIFI